MNRRKWIAGVLPAGAGSWLGSAIAAAASPHLQLYKSPPCGCCGNWADHMLAAGFSFESSNVDDVINYKRQYGVPAELFTCHAAVVKGYVIEGHVPADDVIHMLRDRPEIKGIGVAGMPIGSPGMEGSNPERYETLLFDTNSKLAVFAVHEVFLAGN